MKEERIVWIDWMRVLACLMVMVVHATEPFYLGGDGSLILTRADMYWSALFDCAVRMCVPLFVMASSYLLFPVKQDTGTFLLRRAKRILIPFLLWSLFYACYWGNPAENLQGLLFNFNYAAGHLWFVYMLVGLYLLMPLLSPWAEKVGKRELLAYIAICLLTTTFPILRDWLAGGELQITYGPMGLPRQAQYPLWGEASWNAYGTFYYFCGFMLYLLGGLYLRRFCEELSWRRTLMVAVPAWLVGFGITFGGFIRRVLVMAGDGFPITGGVDKAVWWETTWTNDTIGVAMMTLGTVLLLRKINAHGWMYHHILLPISRASYGMYLAHMVVLASISAWLRDLLGTGLNGILGIWTTPIQISLTAILTFTLVALTSVLLQRLPKVGHYIMG